MRHGASVRLDHKLARRASVTALFAAAIACASGNAHFDVFQYHDQGGMNVLTSDAGMEKVVAPDWLFNAELLWDRIEVSPSPAGTAGGSHVHGAKHAAQVHDGPHDEESLPSVGVVDGVSGASQRASTAGGGRVQHRYEGALGLARQIGHGERPHRLGGEVRVSYEEDYLAITGIADASIDLMRRNLVLSGHLGFGNDRIEPFVPPPGEQELWPATQQRFLVGFGISQVTGLRSVVSATYGLVMQMGTLESPYRRTTVVTTQFAENLPDARWRHSAALQWSFTPWEKVALHHSEGAYYDSWNFHAWIPETALRWQFLENWMLTLRHRHASQDAAEFWQHHYTALDGYRSGDFRLAGLTQEAVTGELSWRLAFAHRVLQLSGFVSRFWQESTESGVHLEVTTLGASAKWTW